MGLRVEDGEGGEGVGGGGRGAWGRSPACRREQTKKEFPNSVVLSFSLVNGSHGRVALVINGFARSMLQSVRSVSSPAC